MAWFTFTDASQGVFTVRLDDPALVAHARGLLAGGTDLPRIGGTIVTAPADWNIGWGFHLDPGRTFFFDMSAEVGDATMAYVQAHLSEAGGAFLPGKVWTGWSTTLTGELRFREGTAGGETLAGGTGADLLLGRNGDDELAGGRGNDHLAGGSGSDLLLGGAGADRMDGGFGADVLRGGDGGDLLLGGAGRDALEGGAGADRIEGGTGDDRITGGAGDDRLAGGAGDDVFVIRPGDGRDRIAFEDGPGAGDRLDLRAFGLDSIPASVATSDGDLRLILPRGDFVTLVGYARLHGAAAFGAEDVIL